MNRLGLIISGGGGKGAYFIGVWKALREYGIDKNITDVSGTSVGALNAVLFTQGNLRIAEDIWMNILVDEILKFDPKKIIEYIVKFIAMKGILNPAISILMNSYSKGIFSREGLVKIIDDNINLEEISTSHYNIYATAYSLSELNCKYFKINGKEPEAIKKILLASSAIPLVFDPEEIDNIKYYDGGLKDNIPIKPLYKIGIRNFIVVHLSRDSILEKEEYKDANIIEIVPDDAQGDLLTGTLDFSREGSIRRMQQGYRDTVKKLKPIYEMGLVQARISKCLCVLKDDNTNFDIKHKKKVLKREELKKEINYLLR